MSQGQGMQINAILESVTSKVLPLSRVHCKCLRPRVLSMANSCNAQLRTCTLLLSRRQWPYSCSRLVVQHYLVHKAHVVLRQSSFSWQAIIIISLCISTGSKSAAFCRCETEVKSLTYLSLMTVYRLNHAALP